jgi:hypothetical protein
MSNKTYELICQHCGQEFTAKSTKAKYHSTACRTAAHRVGKIKALPSPKGDKLAMLMDESDKISIQLKKHLTNVRMNRASKTDWFEIDDLQARDRVLIREIADLLTK